MERRVLLAIFLALLVLYVWQALFVKPVPKPGTAGGPSAATGSPVAGTSTAPPTAQGGTAPATPLTAEAPVPAAAPSPAAPAAKALVGETSERDVRVETRSVIAVFTNKGARLKSWRLKRYLDHQNPPQPQELVENTTNQPLPFS